MSSNKGLGTMMLKQHMGSSEVFVDVKKLFEDVKFMIKTPKGSVLGNLEYGSDLQQMLYMKGTEATLDLVSTSIYDVLSKFNGVTILNVKSTLTPDKKIIVVKYDIMYNATKVSNELLVNTEV